MILRAHYKLRNTASCLHFSSVTYDLYAPVGKSAHSLSCSFLMRPCSFTHSKFAAVVLDKTRNLYHSSSALGFRRFKMAIFTAFPLGGRWTKQSFGRMRGATCFLPELFQSRVATCSSASRSSAPCFPLWEPLSNCRFKAISASRVASDSEPREVRPFLRQSPL